MAEIALLFHSSSEQELVDQLTKYLSSQYQLPNDTRPRIWNLLLLGNNSTRELDIPIRQLHTALNSLSDTVKEQIWLDVSRLRPNLGLFQQQQVRVVAYCILCLFCYQHNLSYFQGLHEILAPFMFLFQHETTWMETDQSNSFHWRDCSIPQAALCSPLWKSYPLFGAFLHRFAPFLLEKPEETLFRLLKRAFYYFQSLLLYHRPALFWTLAQAEITPDMYCVSWFVTLFARNLNLEELFALYDCLLVSGNVMSIFYFALEWIVRHESILLQVHRAILPETLMNMTLQGTRQVWETWFGGQEKQAITPLSFHRRFYRALYERKEYFVEEQQLWTGNRIVEIQVDDWLEEWKNETQEDVKEASSSSPHLPFFLCDCRSKEEYDSGHLAIAVRVAWESFQDPKSKMVPYPNEQVLKEIVSQMFEPVRDIVRICLIGSGDAVLDPLDVYPLAWTLTRSHFAYVSILSGGIHSVLEWKQHKEKGRLPHYLDWVDLDCTRQKWIEETRKAHIQSTMDSLPSFGWNSSSMVDFRQSLGRMFSKLVRGGKTVSTLSPSTQESKYSNTQNTDKIQDQRMVSKQQQQYGWDANIGKDG